MAHKFFRLDTGYSLKEHGRWNCWLWFVFKKRAKLFSKNKTQPTWFSLNCCCFVFETTTLLCVQCTKKWKKKRRRINQKSFKKKKINHIMKIQKRRSEKCVKHYQTAKNQPLNATLSTSLFLHHWCFSAKAEAAV